MSETLHISEATNATLAHVDNLPQLQLIESLEHKTATQSNDSYAKQILDQSIQQLFEKQVSLSPQQPAVQFANQNLSYNELNKRANQLAHHIKKLDIKPDTPIASCLDRGIDMVVTLLAILKAGGAFTPIDPNYPESRKEYMLQDSQAPVLITTSQLKISGNNQAKLILLDQDQTLISQQSTDNPSCTTNANNLAYVIYTSGSTGTPKGVALEHRTINNLIHWQINNTDNQKKHIAQFAALGFDVSLQEIFFALLTGNQLHIVDNDTRKSMSDLNYFLQQQNITHLFIPTSLLEHLSKEMLESQLAAAQLKEIIVAGEALKLTDNIKKFLARHSNIQIKNHYGPSETHVATEYILSPQTQTDSAPIGKPISNTQIYILDQALKPVADGDSGELYIAGAGVARGYLNRAELNQQRFIDDPFAKHGKMYKTGDLARYLPDGNIEFIGRADAQVKIRGFRVELGEIESTLLAHPQVKECVTVQKEAEGHKYLAAYLVTNGEKSNIDLRELRLFLAKQLPEYMIPTAFIALDELPLTPNLKIDKNNLKSNEQGYHITNKDHTKPRTPAEKDLVKMFCKILGLKYELLSIRDNFFELGVDSISAIQIISRIKDLFYLKLSIKDFFNCPTIESLASHIFCKLKGRQPTPANPIVKAHHSHELPLSYNQQRLWFLAKLEPENPYYNETISLHLQGKLNLDALQKSLHDLVKRHEAFHSKIIERDGKACQTITNNKDIKLRLETHKISKLSAIEKRQYIEKLAHKTFNIENDFLYCFHLLENNKNDHHLLICMHHIITDGWSNYNLLRDLSLLYQAYKNQKPNPLTPLTIQPSDYAAWQQQNDDTFKQELKYWKTQLKDFTPSGLPADYARSQIKNYSSNSLNCKLSKSLTNQLAELAKQKNTTLYNVLLSSLNVLLFQYSKKTDMIIGTASANRTDTRLEDLVGFFVNTLALRSDLSNNPSFDTLLKQNSQTILKAHENQDVPFEKIVEVICQDRSINSNPIFQTVLSLEPMDVSPPKITRKTRIESIDKHSSKFDLVMLFKRSKHGLEGTFEYANELFEASTIALFIERFKYLLEQITQTPDKKISDFKLATTAERQKLLTKWNNQTLHYPKDKTLVELFQQQVIAKDNTSAINVAGKTTSYQALNNKANHLAKLLIQHGCEKQATVAIMAKPSELSIAAIFGILKAGDIYLPIDPNLPTERIAYMLDSCNVNTVLTTKELTAHQAIKNKTIMTLETLSATFDEAPIASTTTSDDTAYIIFTSGSTGKPKAVPIKHRNISNMLYSTEALAELKPGDHCSLLANTIFDVSIYEIFSCLLFGGELYIYDQEITQNNIKIIEKLKADKINSAYIPPFVISTLVDDIKKNKAEYAITRMLVGVEPIKQEKLNVIQTALKNCTILNGYGPTEATVFCTLYKFTPGKNPDSIVPIGRALNNSSVYILDEKLNLSPIGVPGEIFIAGDGLSTGYLQTDLNKNTFVDNPHSTSHCKMYRTGDLAKWSADGNIHFIGRTDDQIKIRGFRIEPQEIASAINSFPNIASSYIHPDKEKQIILAYVTLKEQRLAAPFNQQDSWQPLFDEIYGSPSAAKQNTIGWIDSYSKQSIPSHEMKEWADNSVQRILNLKPKNILEIGCGTGLLLFPLKNHCQHYHGTDFSQQALDCIKENLFENDKHVTLSVMNAEKINKDYVKDADTVVINSVIQYLPNIQSLSKLLRTISDNIKPAGKIYLGDIRNFDLLELFYASMEMAQLEPDTSFTKWYANLQQKLLAEEELSISPQYFSDFFKQCQRDASISIQLRRGKYKNEMSMFRYDVIIEMDKKPQQASASKEIAWEEHFDLNAIKTLTKEKITDSITIHNIPNARIYQFAQQLKHVKDAQSFKQIKQIATNTAIDPNDIWNLLDTDNYYKPYISWSDKPGCFELSLIHGDYSSPSTKAHKQREAIANQPDQAIFRKQLVAQIRQHIKQILPSYMQPSHILILKELPINLSGKIDKARLPGPLSNNQRDAHYLEKANETEHALGKIIEEVLGISQVGPNENLFSLGLHSLLAVQLVAKIKEELNINLAIKMVFQAPSIRELACFVQKSQGEHKRNSIVCLQDQGRKTPLFLIHPIGGTIFWYQKLTQHLTHDRPIYGIQDPAIEEHAPNFNTFEEMASFYLEEIKKIQPHGPYVLGGASFGGNMAVEIAQQLKQQGETTELIVMFDSWARYPEGYQNKKFFDELMQNSTEKLSEDLKALGVTDLKHWIDLQWHRASLIWNYQIPHNISEKIILFKAAIAPPKFKDIDTSDNYWGKHANAIHNDTIPGSHESIFENPGLEVMAEKLQNRLNELD